MLNFKTLNSLRLIIIIFSRESWKQESKREQMQNDLLSSLTS